MGRTTDGSSLRLLQGNTNMHRLQTDKHTDVGNRRSEKWVESLLGPTYILYMCCSLKLRIVHEVSS